MHDVSPPKGQESVDPSLDASSDMIVLDTLRPPTGKPKKTKKKKKKKIDDEEFKESVAK